MNINELKTNLIIRSINESGVKKIELSISDVGFLDSKPLIINQDNEVICGHHRLLACKNLSIENVPVIQKTLNLNESLKLAWQDNFSNDSVVPTTFVDSAQFIWEQKGTQQETAEIMGWSRGKVSNYIALKVLKEFEVDVDGEINVYENDTWKVIATHFENLTLPHEEGGVAQNATNVAISEGLLRPILSLTPDQQLDLVEGLISQKYSKQSFKKKAEIYQQQNKDIVFATEQLKDIVTDELFNQVIEEIETGKYDLNLLIQNAIDKHNKETSIRIINDDCIKGLAKLEDESVDLIATDPPYNMDKEYWDSYGSGEEFAKWCAQWMAECQRILKPGGSIYIFGINRMLSHLQRWLDENMVYRNWIIWDIIQGAGGGLWVNRHEAILYYSKTNDTYEDSDSVKLERHEENIREYNGKEYKFKNPSNIWRFPRVDHQHKDRTEHITQKPVEIMDRIIKASCPVGGLVCDPFSGSGTTAVSAYRNNRKFIGFEMDKVNYTESIKRVNSEIQV